MSADCRVLMIAFNFPPSTTAGVHRSLRFAKYLSMYGCAPTVLTRNAENDAGGSELLKQIPEGVPVVRIGQAIEHSPNKPQAFGTKVDYGPSFKKRIKNLLRPFWELATETPDQHIGWSNLVAKHAIEMCRSGQFDVVYTTGPPHSAHLAGAKIHRNTQIPWIADFRDPWARRPWTKSRNPLGQKFLKYFESKVARNATAVLLNNDASEQDFEDAYPRLPSSKFVALPNGFDPELLPLVMRLQDERQNANNRATPVICHPGTLYGRRDPSAILKALALLHRQGINVQFQQVGSVSDDFPPGRIGRELGIEHLVQVLPPVSHREVFEYMADCDILMVIQPQGPLMVPGKVYEMLMFDQPIVGVCDGKATNSVLASAGRAWVSPSDDIQGIALAIRSALNSDRSDLATRKAARETFNGQQLCKRFADIIHDCVKGTSNLK